MKLISRVSAGGLALLFAFVAGDLAYVFGSNVWKDKQTGWELQGGLLGFDLHGWQIYTALIGLALVALALAIIGVWFWFGGTDRDA